MEAFPKPFTRYIHVTNKSKKKSCLRQENLAKLGIENQGEGPVNFKNEWKYNIVKVEKYHVIEFITPMSSYKSYYFIIIQQKKSVANLRWYWVFE